MAGASVLLREWVNTTPAMSARPPAVSGFEPPDTVRPCPLAGCAVSKERSTAMATPAIQPTSPPTRGPTPSAIACAACTNTLRRWPSGANATYPACPSPPTAGLPAYITGRRTGQGLCSPLSPRTSCAIASLIRARQLRARFTIRPASDGRSPSSRFSLRPKFGCFSVSHGGFSAHRTS